MGQFRGSYRTAFEWTAIVEKLTMSSSLLLGKASAPVVASRRPALFDIL